MGDRHRRDVSRPRRGGSFRAENPFRRWCEDYRPDVVVIAAAYTAVDRAESEEALAHVINAEAPGVIAAAAGALDIPVVFISTDYVFDGEKGVLDGEFYTEFDTPNPLNAYGRSKLAGEQAVQAANPRHLILRTSWLYSSFGTNFVKTMVELAKSRARVEIVADQVGCPTAAADLAQAIAGLVPQLLEPASNYGLYHLASPTDVSWYDLGERVFRTLESAGLKRPQNAAISAIEYGSPARRPRNSRLSGALIRETFGVSLPSLEASLPKVLRELTDV